MITTTQSTVTTGASAKTPPNFPIITQPRPRSAILTWDTFLHNFTRKNFSTVLKTGQNLSCFISFKINHEILQNIEISRTSSC